MTHCTMSGTHFLKTTWLRAQGASEARFADLTWIIELNSRPPKIGRRWSLTLGHSSATVCAETLESALLTSNFVGIPRLPRHLLWASSRRLSVWLTTAATTGGGTGDWTTGFSRTTCHQNRMSQHGIASNVPWWEPWGTARGKCMSGGLL